MHLIICLYNFACSLPAGHQNFLQVSQNGKFRLVESDFILQDKSHRRENFDDSLSPAKFSESNPIFFRTSKIFKVPVDTDNPSVSDRREISRDFLLETLERFFEGEDEEYDTRQERLKRMPLKKERKMYKMQDTITEPLIIEPPAEPYPSKYKRQEIKPQTRVFTKTKGIPVWTHVLKNPDSLSSLRNSAESQSTNMQYFSEDKHLKESINDNGKLYGIDNVPGILVLEKEIAKELRDTDSLVDLPVSKTLLPPKKEKRDGSNKYQNVQSMDIENNLRYGEPEATNKFNGKETYNGHAMPMTMFDSEQYKNKQKVSIGSMNYQLDSIDSNYNTKEKNNIQEGKTHLHEHQIWDPSEDSVDSKIYEQVENEDEHSESDSLKPKRETTETVQTYSNFEQFFPHDSEENVLTTDRKSIGGHKQEKDLISELEVLTFSSIHSSKEKEIKEQLKNNHYEQLYEKEIKNTDPSMKYIENEERNAIYNKEKFPELHSFDNSGLPLKNLKAGNNDIHNSYSNFQKEFRNLPSISELKAIKDDENPSGSHAVAIMSFNMGRHLLNEDFGFV